MRLSLVAIFLACPVIFSHAQEKKDGIYLKGDVNNINAEEFMRHTADASGDLIMYLTPGPRHSVTVVAKGPAFMPFDEFLPRCRIILGEGQYLLSPAGPRTWWADRHEVADRILEPVEEHELGAAPPDLRIWCAVYVSGDGKEVSRTASALGRSYPGLQVAAALHTMVLSGRAIEVRDALAVLRRHEQFDLQRRALAVPPNVDLKHFDRLTTDMDIGYSGGFAVSALEGRVFARGTSVQLDTTQQLLNALEK